MFPPDRCAVGVGLRPVHYPHLLSRPKTNVLWFEAISENFMDSEGRPRLALEAIRRDYPVALHGVSMSIGSAEGVDAGYLKRLKALVDRTRPFVVSDHLCWTGLPDNNLHNLLPLPMTQESVRWIAGQVSRVQDFLGREIALENVSTYARFAADEMPEWEFMTTIARSSGCKILLDVNNVHVSAVNHGFDPKTYLDAIVAELVAQIHLGGPTDMGGWLFDTHAKPVPDPVWELYGRVIARMPGVPVLIEWDEDIPPFERLEAEAVRAAQIWDHYHAGRTPRSPATIR